MTTLDEMKKAVAPGGAWHQTLDTLYGPSADGHAGQVARYQNLMDEFAAAFPNIKEAALFSTPGRTEVLGNHTDHNAGYVLAAAVELDVLAVAAPTADGVITLHSEGYAPIRVDTRHLAPAEAEKYTSAAIVRGVCARMAQLGYTVGGFCACCTSTVLKASGLSSSAAFEVLIVSILSQLYNNGAVPPIKAAQIAQWAENEYFGKPCGLMDQTACAVGGFVFIDFCDFDNPVVEQVAFNFADSGYALAIVDTGGDHADLNEDYTLLENEMKDCAKALGKPVLRPLSADVLMENLPRLRAQGLSDRAILRAFHFFGEDKRVVEGVRALKAGDFETFKQMVVKSGESSWMLCQNVYAPKHLARQGASVALAASEQLLGGGGGAWRIHGGGFAGTIQAFVPEATKLEYFSLMRKLFGENAVYSLFIRPVGMFCFQAHGPLVKYKA